MKKLSLKVCKHFGIVCLEIIGAVAGLACIVVLALMWRLSQGPLNIDFMTGYIEDQLNKQSAEYVFDIERTDLTWNGLKTPVQFHINDANILRADATPVMSVARIAIQIDKSNLLLGRIVPQMMTVYGLVIRVVRHEDGTVSLNVHESAAPEETAPETPEGKAGQEEKNGDNVVADTLASLRAAEARGVFKGIERLSIADATLLFDDRKSGSQWPVDRARLDLEPGEGGINGSLEGALDLGERGVDVSARFFHGWSDSETKLQADFKGLYPPLLAAQMDALKEAKKFGINLRGRLETVLDKSLIPTTGTLKLKGGAGDIQIPVLYDAPTPIRGLEAELSFDLGNTRLEMERIAFDLGKSGRTVFDGSVAIRPDEEKGEDVLALVLHGVGNDMPIDKLSVYWPHVIAPKTRAWVTEHISDGVVPEATVNLEFDLPMSIVRGEKEFVKNENKPKKLDGVISYRGATTDYLPDLTPATDVKGTATYTFEEFVLDVESGKVDDMTIEKADIYIDNFHVGPPPNIDIKVKVSGPARTALEQLNKHPLGYLDKMGLDPAQVGGTVRSDFRLRFPVSKSLTLKQIKFDVSGVMSDAVVTGAVGDYSLTGGPFDFTAENSGFDIKGDGKLAGTPVKIAWRKNFLDDAGFGNRIQADLVIGDPFLAPLKSHDALEFDGAVPARLVYTSFENNRATVDVKGDLTAARFAVPDFDFVKPAGVKGDIDMLVHLDGSRVDRITALDVRTNGLELRGEIALRGGWTDVPYALESADLRTLRIGKTKVSGHIDNPPEHGIQARLRGDTLDATVFFDEREKEKQKAAENGDDYVPIEPTLPFSVELDVGELITGADSVIDHAKVFMKRSKWREIEKLEMDAIAGRGQVYLRYGPADDGRYKLRFEADDAGAALKTLGITDSVRGGVIVVDGQPAASGGPKDMAGVIQMTDFKVVDLPALARVLNALSLPGFHELMTSDGISFAKMKSGFKWTYRAPPIGKDPVKVLTLRNGRTSGASLGLSFEGDINMMRQTLDLDGTIVPVSGLNKMVSGIPILGQILSGGGDAMFAATYKVKGPAKAPTTTVNPLAVLAPGFLRTIFFED